MNNCLLSGLLVGLLFGVPVGAVGAITAQRTLHHGIKAGLVTGLGSSIADCLYAWIGVFGLTLVSDFLLSCQRIISIFGGSLIIVMGIRMILNKKKNVITPTSNIGGIKMFLSSFGIGITNPTAILTFLFAFSYLEISKLNIYQGIQLVGGVFIGTYIWWVILSIFVDILKKKAMKNSYLILDKVFGLVLTLLGTAVFVRIIL